MTVLGILHPGSMGAAVASQARHRGEVLWCSTGRSTASKERAQRYGLTPVHDVGEMTERADIIMSVCPPANALEVAATVAAHSFSGIYVDANAVAPATMASISATMLPAGATIVDGSIIGSPPSDVKTTRLYLSGPPEALTTVARLFTDSAVKVHLLSSDIGRASALKLSYSSYQKASRVLAAVAYALAADWGVEEELLHIAESRTTSYLSETAYVPKVAARAWRWAPEMREAASALAELSLPPDLVEATARVVEQWSEAKDRPMELHEALALLHSPQE
ncbi:NAD(P)-dependent oxidoreductase [Streptomyces sp. PR69]|uniref:NAD(P)-dependent oxidoreductase n=1 Tax=Streptomyces sp. PR69 TaxID=2984950 RepID=UPI0022656B25|nr:NAD(P)-dependent oxidoreductase [Streptomyces sp. PR69]